MNLSEGIATLLSVSVFVTLVASICVRRRRTSLIIQSVSCLLESIYSLLIGALTGSAINLINFIRSGIFVNKKHFNRMSYRLILVLFCSIILINCSLTWAGPVSLLPTAGSLIRTYCLWQTNMKLVRISGVTTGLFYGLYFVLYQGWLMALGYGILLLVSLVEVLYWGVFGRKRRVAKNASVYHRRLCYQEMSIR